jgi:hypothetical protein
MATPKIGWPYSLAKRNKAYAVVYADAQNAMIISRGGRIAADALTRNDAGDYTIAINPPLQNDGASIVVALTQKPGQTPLMGTISAALAVTRDAVNVITTDGADPADRHFTIWIAEALISEQIAAWPNPV